MKIVRDGNKILTRREDHHPAAIETFKFINRAKAYSRETYHKPAQKQGKQSPLRLA